MIRANQNTHLYGYVLGLPFMQAFNVVFDYENGKVGFGNKKKGNEGALIYGIPDPVPEDDHKEEDRSDIENEDPDQTTDEIGHKDN